MKKRNGLKILLIEPPFHRLFHKNYSYDRLANGLINLAGVILEKTEWDVLVYNADYQGFSIPVSNSFLTGKGFENFLKRLEDHNDIVWREVKSVIAENQPDVVGISAKSPNYDSACLVARFAKEFNPKITVVMGGPHPSLPGVYPVESDDIDIVVKGEGELTIVELLERIERNAPFDGVAGLVYKKNGRVIENERRPLMPDLDELPFPHETAEKVLINYDDYPIRAYKHVYTTRGCPFNCIFCGGREIWGRKVRFRSPENVIRELRGLQAKGLRYVSFQDDTFAIDPDYLRKLCQLIIRDCPNLSWSCLTHVKMVNEETMLLMKAAGCESVHIGVESGNNDILRSIRKSITIEEALTAAETIKKCGMRVYGFFMIGYPEETEETLSDTIEVMKNDLFDQVIYNVYTPHPGTEAFQDCYQKNLVNESFDVRLYNHQSPHNHFCPKIPKARFREIASRVERMADKKNARYRAKALFTKAGFVRIRELGVRQSLARGYRMFVG